MYTQLICFLNSIESQKGMYKLNDVLRGHLVWERMTGTEHQKFGKYLKANKHLLNNNVHFYETSSNNDGIYK